MKPFFFISVDKTSPMQSLFLCVAGKKVYYPKLKESGNAVRKFIFEILFYLTCLSFGDLKNITFKLKNNIEIVNAGKM